jgi:hypothetical protein
LRAISSAATAIVLCIATIAIAVAVWPASRWVGTAADLLDVRGLILPTLANAVVVVCTYLAAAALVWGFADALMDQPINLGAYDTVSGGPTWRIALLSDIHLVGERYGFRIESAPTIRPSTIRNVSGTAVRDRDHADLRIFPKNQSHPPRGPSRACRTPPSRRDHRTEVRDRGPFGLRLMHR